MTSTDIPTSQVEEEHNTPPTTDEVFHGFDEGQSQDPEEDEEEEDFDAWSKVEQLRDADDTKAFQLILNSLTDKHKVAMSRALSDKLDSMEKPYTTLSLRQALQSLMSEDGIEVFMRQQQPGITFAEKVVRLQALLDVGTSLDPTRSIAEYQGRIVLIVRVYSSLANSNCALRSLSNPGTSLIEDDYYKVYATTGFQSKCSARIQSLLSKEQGFTVDQDIDACQRLSDQPFMRNENMEDAFEMIMSGDYKSIPMQAEIIRCVAEEINKHGWVRVNEEIKRELTVDLPGKGVTATGVLINIGGSSEYRLSNTELVASLASRFWNPLLHLYLTNTNVGRVVEKLMESPEYLPPRHVNRSIFATKFGHFDTRTLGMTEIEELTKGKFAANYFETDPDVLTWENAMKICQPIHEAMKKIPSFRVKNDTSEVHAIHRAYESTRNKNRADRNGASVESMRRPPDNQQDVESLIKQLRDAFNMLMDAGSLACIDVFCFQFTGEQGKTYGDLSPDQKELIIDLCCLYGRCMHKRHQGKKLVHSRYGYFTHENMYVTYLEISRHSLDLLPVSGHYSSLVLMFVR